MAVIRGDKGDNALYGTGEADVLSGEYGNDLLQGGGGRDQFLGGDGVDTITYSDSLEGVQVSFATRRFVGGTADGDNLLDAIENLYGSNYGDLLGGDFGANELRGLDGNDILVGEEGADKLYGDGGQDTLKGGGGDDVLTGGVGNDTLLGGAGADFYYVDSAGDVVIDGVGEGGAGDRVLASASYTLTAGAEIEVFSTADHAGTGAIRLGGNELANAIYGNAGANVIDGGGGADTMLGLRGSDYYYVDNPADTSTRARAKARTTLTPPSPTRCPAAARSKCCSAMRAEPTRSFSTATSSTTRSRAMPAATTLRAWTALTSCSAAKGLTISCSTPASVPTGASTTSWTSRMRRPT